MKGESGGYPPITPIRTLVGEAFSGTDLTPRSDALLDRIERDQRDANALLDLNVVLQLMFKPRLALEMQSRAMGLRRTYHLPADVEPSDLRLLVLMTPGDLMANAPLDFLLEGSRIAVDFVYLTADAPFPLNPPEHDLVFVAVAHSDSSVPVLHQLHSVLANWPKPVLNPPEGILRTTREGALTALAGEADVVIPELRRAIRHEAEQTGGSWHYPCIIRPTDSHAGHGLSRLSSPEDLSSYLTKQPEPEFFISPFLDYRSPDGRFRKYRVVLIRGEAFASHMAISDNWMIHYLNAGMTESEEKRDEEAAFMEAFDTDRGFGSRHRTAFRTIAAKIGLDYLVVDCAETPEGKLLVFEVDSAAVVHLMDPKEMFPYKHVQMRKVFAAFQRMVYATAGR